MAVQQYAFRFPLAGDITRTLTPAPEADSAQTLLGGVRFLFDQLTDLSNRFNDGLGMSEITTPYGPGFSCV